MKSKGSKITIAGVVLYCVVWLIIIVSSYMSNTYTFFEAVEIYSKSWFLLLIKCFAIIVIIRGIVIGIFERKVRDE